MSIFNEVITHFIQEAVELLRDKSKKSDESFINGVRSIFPLFKIGRDLPLSQQKRDELLKLKNNIETIALKQNEKTDLELKTEYRLAITVCLNQIITLCENKNLKAGYTGDGLLILANFVDRVHEKICLDLDLGDTPYDQESLNCFQFYAAKTCAHNIYETNIIKSPQNFPLLIEKEQLIKDNIQAARTYVAPKIFTPAIKAQQIKERAEAVKREAQEIDNKHWLEIGGPIFKLSENYLDNYMNCVINEQSKHIGKNTSQDNDTKNIEPESTIRPGT